MTVFLNGFLNLVEKPLKFFVFEWNLCCFSIGFFIKHSALLFSLNVSRFSLESHWKMRDSWIFCLNAHHPVSIIYFSVLYRLQWSCMEDIVILRCDIFLISVMKCCSAVPSKQLFSIRDWFVLYCSPTWPQFKVVPPYLFHFERVRLMIAFTPKRLVSLQKIFMAIKNRNVKTKHMRFSMVYTTQINQLHRVTFWKKLFDVKLGIINYVTKCHLSPKLHFTGLIAGERNDLLPVQSVNIKI